MPPRIFVQRSIASAFWVSCCIGAHQTLFRKRSISAEIPLRANARTPVYYLPVRFQAIAGNSAVESGIHLLPMVLSLVVASILTGILTTRVGYYMPFLIFGICVTAVGAGLLTTLSISTVVGQWIGYQIVYGYGLGCSFQAPNMAAQTVLPRNEVSIGAALMLFAQTLFGAIFVSVGQNVLDNQLAKRFAHIPGIGISPQLFQNTGATEFLELIPAEYYTAAQQAYNDSLRVCFRVGLIMACLSILGALGMEWRSVKKSPKNADGEQAAEEGKGGGDLSEEEAPEAEAEAEAKAAADGERDAPRDETKY